MAHRQQDLHEPAKPLTTAASLSWPLSILSAFLTGIVGMLAAGLIAAACVDWYSVSSREGASGYFVIAIAFLGFIAGCLIGIVTARVVAAGADPGFLKALLRSLAVVGGLAVLSGGTARLLADVPPELDGETLMLALEVRWPEDQAGSPAAGDSEGTLTLHSVPFYSNTVRASESGPLWIQDAQRVDGRWVARGAVSIFTSRGKRLLVVTPNGDETAESEGFLVPLPARPGKRSLAWSDWLPRTRPGVSPHNKLTYRFRAQPVSQAVRTEVIRDWEVDTRASNFYNQQVDGRTIHAATATFALRHAKQEVRVGDSADEIDNVALLPGAEPAFLVHLSRPGGDGRNYLVSAEGDQVRATDVGEGYIGMRGQPLTADTTLFRATRGSEVPHGLVDRVSYASPGLYLMGQSVVDTRRLVVHPFTPDTSAIGIPSVPPLSLSPDKRSFVSFANAGYPSEAHVLVVTNFVDNHTYVLPVDEARMRFPDFDALDPAWIAHHFEWKRGSEGADRLVERPRFTPLPYHGAVTTESNGDRSYRIEKASDSLRTALVAFLVARFHAEPGPADSGAYEYPVKIGDHVVNVAHSPGFGYVLVSLKDPGTDSTLVPDIAAQFDAALATGRYDSMFGK